MASFYSQLNSSLTGTATQNNLSEHDLDFPNIGVLAYVVPLTARSPRVAFLDADRADQVPHTYTTETPEGTVTGGRVRQEG